MKIKKRQMYAVTAGQYLGNFLVFTDNNPNNDSYVVIVLPDLIETYIPVKDVEEGLKHNILDFVKKLSRGVYKELIDQIEIRKKQMIQQQEKVLNEYYNRREQLTTSDVLDSEEFED